MPAKDSTSAKIRTDDQEAIQSIAATFGSDGITIISAMRRLWESSSEKRQLAAIKKVNATDSEVERPN